MTKYSIVKALKLHGTMSPDHYYQSFGNLPDKLQSKILECGEYSIKNDKSTIFRDTIVFEARVKIGHYDVLFHDTVFSLEEWSEVEEIDESEFNGRVECHELNDIRVEF